MPWYKILIRFSKLTSKCHLLIQFYSYEILNEIYDIESHIVNSNVKLFFVFD